MKESISEAFEYTREAGSVASATLDELTKIIKPGVTSLNNLIIGLVYFTKTLIKKNSESSL